VELEARIKIPKHTVGRGNRRLDPEMLRALLAKGHTAKEIGVIFGVTKQRIHQIVGSTGHPKGRRPFVSNKINAVLPKLKGIIYLTPVRELSKKGSKETEETGGTRCKSCWLASLVGDPPRLWLRS
jgi:hypothetical protein